jgi:parvulin-like peptidyl-prolyl isomerase
MAGAGGPKTADLAILNAMRSIAAPLVLMAACGTVSERPEPPVAPETGRPPAATAAPERPPVVWRGEVIEWHELRPMLAERAGAVVLEEALLDRQVDRLLAEQRLQLDQAAVDAERARILEALSPEPDRAERLLRELRAVQGLGESRWQSLLRRNAGLRRLVQSDVQVTPEAVAAAMDAAHGPRRRCRVIALPDLKACADARAELDAGTPFGEVAAARSTDASAARGGLVNPVSRLDPSWPSSFRQALWELKKDQVSPPVLVEGGYVLIRLEEELPAVEVDPATARVAAEREVRRGQERVLMETLVTGLRQAQRDVMVTDPALRDAWTRVRSEGR